MPPIKKSENRKPIEQKKTKQKMSPIEKSENRKPLAEKAAAKNKVEVNLEKFAGKRKLLNPKSMQRLHLSTKIFTNILKK